MEVDKIDIDKLKAVPDDLRKLSNVVDNDVVKILCMINYSQRLTPFILVDVLKNST